MPSEHNPEKSRVVCAVAKGSIWGLRLFLTTIILSALALLVVSAYSYWDWAGIGKGILAVIVAALLVAIIVGVPTAIIVLVDRWYAWAKTYAKDC